MDEAFAQATSDGHLAIVQWCSGQSNMEWYNNNPLPQESKFEYVNQAVSEYDMVNGDDSEDESESESGDESEDENKDENKDDDKLNIKNDTKFNEKENRLEDLQCICCNENKRNVVFVPCGHSVCCNACSQKIKDSSNACPICRATVSCYVNYKLS